MKEKQQTFGKVEFRDCSHNREKCNKNVEGERCVNNAVVHMYNKSVNNSTYRCGVHAPNFALREINYNE